MTNVLNIIDFDMNIRKISKARLGMEFTKEHKENLKESHKGQIPWNKGKKNCYSNETIKRMSEAGSKHIKEKSSRWKGGKIEVNCYYCGRLFKIAPSIIKIGKGKYCSKKCYTYFMKEYPNKGTYKKGHVVTTKIRDKISNSKKGQSGYWLDKPRSEETKLKIKKSLFMGGSKESEKRRYIKSRKYNLKYQLNQRMREGFCRTLKNGIKNGRHWENLVPYNFIQLKNHLQKTLPENYSWQDFFQGKFHIDHIIPINAYEFDKPEDFQFQECWALENLRLLPRKENLRKSKKIIKSYQICLKL